MPLPCTLFQGRAPSWGPPVERLPGKQVCVQGSGLIVLDCVNPREAFRAMSYLNLALLLATASLYQRRRPGLWKV